MEQEETNVATTDQVSHETVDTSACDQEEDVPELEGCTKQNASHAASGQVSHVTCDIKEPAGTRRVRPKHPVTLDALLGACFQKDDVPELEGCIKQNVEEEEDH